MKIPKSVEDVKIVDSVIELRFAEKLNVFVAYSLIKDLFDNEIQELPVNQISLKVRESDENLKYQATHAVTDNRGFVINIGEYVIGFGWSTSYTRDAVYPGWTPYYDKYKEVYSLISKPKNLPEVIQVGIRYVNIFDEGEFFSNSSINLNFDAFATGNTSDFNIGFIVDKENYRIRLIANSNAVLANSAGETISGEVVDIDAQMQRGSIKNPLQSVKTMHTGVKEAYFQLLKPDYIDKLRPSYEN